MALAVVDEGIGRVIGVAFDALLCFPAKHDMSVEQMDLWMRWKGCQEIRRIEVLILFMFFFSVLCCFRLAGDDGK